MREQLYRWRCWFEDRFPDRRQRRLAAALIPLLLVCAVWVLVFAIGGLMPESGGGARITPEIRHAQDLTRKLHEHAAFVAVTVLPHLDYPDRLRVSGSVPSPADVESLKARLTELDPAAQYVVEVRTGE